MIVTYIARIRGKMNFLIVENIHLLNGMHEGLIVVDEEDMDLKFATIPAVTLLKHSTTSNPISSFHDCRLSQMDLRSI